MLERARRFSGDPMSLRSGRQQAWGVKAALRAVKMRILRAGELNAIIVSLRPLNIAPPAPSAADAFDSFDSFDSLAPRVAAQTRPRAPACDVGGPIFCFMHGISGWRHALRPR